MAASMGGAFHTGADFEAGRVHAVQQEQRLPGVEPADAREGADDEPAFARGNGGGTIQTIDECSAHCSANDDCSASTD